MEKAGHDHVALITDCMMAGGMPDGNYNLGEFPVVVKRRNSTSRIWQLSWKYIEIERSN